MTRKSRLDIERAASRSRQAMLEAASPVRRIQPQAAASAARAVAEAAAPSAVDRRHPKIWIIYARENEGLARELVRRLREDEVVVAWDRDLPPGVDYDQHIEHAIRTCDKAVAIWTSAALQSRFVLDEAILALELGKLVPVHAADYDPLRLPMRFRRLQSTGLAHYDTLLAALRSPPGPPPG